MESNEDIIATIEKECELINGHLIWKGEIKNGNARMTFPKDRKTVAAWYYLATNNLSDLPENTTLESFCNTRHCLSHHEPISHYECITMLTVHDVLYFIGKMDSMTKMQGNCKIVTGLKPTPNGYVRSTLWGKHWLLHVATYCVHHAINREEIGDDEDVAHDCGNRLCVNIEHLFRKTKSDNMKDKIKHGTERRGAKHPRTKMDEQTVLRIIASYGNGKTAKERAQEFQVSKHIVVHLDNAQSWKHLFTESDLKKRANNKRKRDDADTSSAPKRSRITDTKEVFYAVLRARIKQNIKIEADEKHDDHWIWQLGKLPATLYGAMKIVKNPWITGATSHRVSYQVFNNVELSADILVRHDCLREDCCNPQHLSEGTAQENADDMLRDGTRLFGERHPNATITAELAKQIKQSKGEGTKEERAIRFGVSHGIVSSIDTGAAWKSV